MKVVHMMRGAAPDKFNMWTDKSYEMINHDFTNLVDYSEEEIEALDEKGEYIISADEGDILHVNKFTKNHSSIILPKDRDGKVIEYKKYIPKDSRLYNIFQTDKVFRYAPFYTLSLDELKRKIHNHDYHNEVAIKTVTGSGSRGVILVTKNKELLNLGGKYVTDVESSAMWIDFVKFAEKEGCDIMIQDLIPFKEHDLTKVNVDFVIRNGKLLGYKWTATDPQAVFTNWNWGEHVRCEYTDKVMDHVTKILVDYGIHDALMNFEAFSNYINETWLVEFNWRFSNSTFEGQAAKVDLISSYLNEEPFSMVYGRHKFSRYWQCMYYDNNYHLVTGK